MKTPPRLAPASALAFAAALSLAGGMAEAASPAERAANERIVGGTEVRIGDGPWAVRLNVTRGDGHTYICGASLVSPRVQRDRSVVWRHNVASAQWAVTAAHCVFDSGMGGFVAPAAVSAVTGRLDLADEDTGERRRVVAIMPHAAYDPRTLRNDIALLALDASEKTLPVEMRRSIRLPELSDTGWIGQSYLAVFAQGWGRVAEGGDASARLREVRLPVVETALCRALYGLHGSTIEGGQICAGFRSGGFDSCQGDSGGPLIYRPADGTALSFREEVLVGVVSWGKGCARQDLFGVYSSTAWFRDWMDATAHACLHDGKPLEKCGG